MWQLYFILLGGNNYTIASNSNTNNPNNSKLKFVSDPFPIGMKMSEIGDFNGIPIQSGTWNIKIIVTDFNNISKIDTLEFTVEEGEMNVLNTDNEMNITCYPNPFTQSTLIDFNLAQSQKVKLDVYNISGKKINTLINQQLETGNHQIKFENNKLQEGVYFIKLVTNNNVLTQKIIFIK